MLPDSSSITPATLRALLASNANMSAASAIQPDASESPEEQEVQRFFAQVLQSKPIGVNNHQLTLRNQAQILQVNSHLPLPRGTELTLEISPNNSNNPVVKVTEIVLPKANSLLQAALHKPTAEFIEQTLKPFLSSRLALLNQSNTAASSAQPSSDTYAKPNIQPAPISAPIQPILKPLLNLISSLPQEAQEVLQKWQQQLPKLEQLQTSEHLKNSIKHSGINYEKLVFNALKPALEKPDAANLFKQFLQKNFSQAPAPAPAEVPGKPAAPQSAIGNILEAVKAKLEPTLQAPTATTAAPLDKVAPQLTALLNTDTKAVLGRILMMLSSASSLPMQPQPANNYQPAPETFQQLQRILAHLEHEQGQWLQQQSQSQPQQQQWQLNIPLFFMYQQQPQELQLVIDKESSDDETAGSNHKHIRWRLRLYFDLPELGPLDIDLELQPPKLKASFWSREPKTLALLNHKLQPLRKQLLELGAEVEDLKVLHGQLPEPSRNKIQHHWVDVHG